MGAEEAMSRVPTELENYERERILQRNGGMWNAEAERQLRRQLGRMRKPRVRRAIKLQMREAKRRAVGQECPHVPQGVVHLTAIGIG
jgi:hypothetical protein